MKKFLSKIKICSILFLFSLAACLGGQSNKNDEILEKEKFEPSAYERSKTYAEKNPITIFGKDSKDKNTNFEFSTSNVLWRATLKSLDFLPLLNVDYAGGVILYDWYSEDLNSREQIKVTVRFLNNELRSDSIDVIVHKKNCESFENCRTIKLQNNFSSQLKDNILSVARLIKIEEAKKEKK